MSILSVNTSTTGTVGILPSVAEIVTNDTEAAILATGYMNHIVQQGAQFSLPCMALVSTMTSATAAPDVGWYEVQHTGSNWNLIPSKAPGSVTLPTIANHIATYLDVNGSLGEDAATAINGGNIQAGLSGTAGTIASFPGTAAKGSLVLKAINNTGNTISTISNAAMGQASVISIPDPGVATSNFIIADSTGTQAITTGNLAVSLGTINATTGNIVAGSSGHAGVLATFPSTVSTGELQLAAVSNTGNTVTTISNNAMGQGSVINIPDPANAIGQFLIGATATPFVSGNFPKNSGTAGLMVDSGVTVASLTGAVTQLGQLYQVSVTFNTASMVTAYDTPLTIVANPSASQMILVIQASVYTASTGHTAYATGTAPIIQYSTGGTNGQHGAGTIATAAGLVAGDITAAASQVRNLFGIATAANTGLSGKGLYFSNATGDYTAGTGTNITITVVYQLLTATV